MILRGARVFTDGAIVEGGWVRLDGPTVAEVGRGHMPPGDSLDLTGRLLVPGFVDMHVHGGGGASFQSGDAGDVRRAAEHHLSFGTTTLLASLVTRPVDELVSSIERMSWLVGSGVIAGIHLEGPFLAPGRCGAHDPSLLVPPSSDDVARLLAAGPIAMVTLAPELAGGIEAVRQIVSAGAVAAIGHTDVSYDVARSAIEAGATVGTHLFNAMTPVHHRAPGPVVALLEDPRVTVELIHDGEHLHGSLVRDVFSTVGPSRVALVSDAIAASGLGDGGYRIGELDVTVADGFARLTDNGALAGSTLTVSAAMRNAVSSGVPLIDALTAATSSPARVLGLDSVGRIAAGCAADLVILSDSLDVDAVMKAGLWSRPFNRLPGRP